MTGAGTGAVFAHFDPGGEVSAYVHRYLAELAAAVDTLVVVSTADLGAASRAELAAYGRLVVRPNVGYDFSSWKAGLDEIGALVRFDRVVLANDSVIGPVGGIGRVLAHPPAADFWAMTASAEIAPHLQSWFIGYEGSLLRTGLVGAFWAAVAIRSSGATRSVRAGCIGGRGYRSRPGSSRACGSAPSPRSDTSAGWRRSRRRAARARTP